MLALGLPIARHVYWASAFRSCIKRFSSNGEFLNTFGECGIDYFQMTKPAGITVLDNGTIIVIDWGNHRAHDVWINGSHISHVSTRWYRGHNALLLAGNAISTFLRLLFASQIATIGTPEPTASLTAC